MTYFAWVQRVDIQCVYSMEMGWRRIQGMNNDMDLIGAPIRNRNIQCNFFAFLPSSPFVIALYRCCQCIRHLIRSYKIVPHFIQLCVRSIHIYRIGATSRRTVSHSLSLTSSSFLVFFCWLNSPDKWIFFFYYFCEYRRIGEHFVPY